MKPRSPLAILRTALAALALPVLAAAAALAPHSAVAAGQAEPAAGVDYFEIDGGQPFQPADGRIEVAEAFSYVCHHCADFEPLLESWARRLPADVRLVRVPAAFASAWIPYARAYYAAESLGVLERTHAGLFKALHERRSLPMQNAAPEEIAVYFAEHGVPAERFVAAMRSAELDARLERAREFLLRSGVDGTPTLIVAGKYRVRGRSYDDSLRIADYLIARERARR